MSLFGVLVSRLTQAASDCRRSKHRSVCGSQKVDRFEPVHSGNMSHLQPMYEPAVELYIPLLGLKLRPSCIYHLCQITINWCMFPICPLVAIESPSSYPSSLAFCDRAKPLPAPLNVSSDIVSLSHYFDVLIFALDSVIFATVSNCGWVVYTTRVALVVYTTCVGCIYQCYSITVVYTTRVALVVYTTVNKVLICHNLYYANGLSGIYNSRLINLLWFDMSGIYNSDGVSGIYNSRLITLLWSCQYDTVKH